MSEKSTTNNRIEGSSQDVVAMEEMLLKAQQLADVARHLQRRKARLAAVRARSSKQKQLEKLTTKTVLDDEIFTALELPLKFVFVVMGFYLAILMLNLPTNIEGILTQFVRSLLMFSLFWGLYYSVEPLSFIIDKLTATTSGVPLNGFKSLLTDRAQLTEGIKSIFVKSSKILIVLIGLMAFLNEWDINIIALLASLGVVGAAVALAAKDMISNSLSSLTIIFDKPFKHGDWIMTSDVEGIVEVYAY